MILPRYCLRQGARGLLAASATTATFSSNAAVPVVAMRLLHRQYSSDLSRSEGKDTLEKADAIKDPVEIAAEGLKTPPTLAPKSSELNKPKGSFRNKLSDHLTGVGKTFFDTYPRIYQRPAENDHPKHHILHVHASANNTILSLTDHKGKVLINTSGGSVGFKKSQRGGFEAAYQAAVKITEKAQEAGIGVRYLEMRFKGFGPGRNASFKAVRSVTNWEIVRVTDATPIPFNGCRPKKARRL
ncbi:hypothetical protein EV182_003362 [Spiromyces aspiralis]|uniref:Uncharacterized protein n=1 Tax=Spiromyces aspiralis TaxID=68401 RepID=A0ACC1HWN5_9FUNG|nr:hypothetical protein EV182_003362 [Spiromyces aspiralis]